MAPKLEDNTIEGDVASEPIEWHNEIAEENESSKGAARTCDKGVVAPSSSQPATATATAEFRPELRCRPPLDPPSRSSRVAAAELHPERRRGRRCLGSSSRAAGVSPPASPRRRTTACGRPPPRVAAPPPAKRAAPAGGARAAAAAAVDGDAARAAVGVGMERRRRMGEGRGFGEKVRKMREKKKV
uniref:Uncharacterized protein n=1 Tax=Oryza sativa subsp. japonica TaxID=39947 RepID=Q69NX4_ORYSJ|nr:hypothetical protein [Oryza sativa Japonica Group]